jgi:hypothetical protein
MTKKRGPYGKYAHEVKVYLKSKGKKAPTLKLTLFLPEEVVRKISPQIERFMEASNKRRSAAKD